MSWLLKNAVSPERFTHGLGVVWEYWLAGGWLMVPLALVACLIWCVYLMLVRRLHATVGAKVERLALAGRGSGHAARRRRSGDVRQALRVFILVSRRVRGRCDGGDRGRRGRRGLRAPGGRRRGGRRRRVVLGMTRRGGEDQQRGERDRSDGGASSERDATARVGIRHHRTHQSQRPRLALAFGRRTGAPRLLEKSTAGVSLLRDEYKRRTRGGAGVISAQASRWTSVGPGAL